MSAKFPRGEQDLFQPEVYWHMYLLLISIIPLCKHVVAKVTLVPCSVNLTGKRDTVGHGDTPFIQIQQTRKGLPNADINNSILNGGG